ncbi:hypothetical protein BDV95DRAFT_603005 [Massariosphaeria phaeospora]|uniref:Uncharacterized protein n=1 Tax=Massariosphaeria phaeospora TaxID=100035 RepID=A0A7C8IBR6_9PLEO|nr:hypothetical protein BDV95DRAFT_603005 [Massariosphaeria phaeospora]
MLLLDFPPEIFQRIIHEFVSSTGVAEAWKARRVCRTFANEVRQDVLAFQRTTAFTNQLPHTQSSIIARRILASNLRIYLANRSKNILDANDFLLVKLKNFAGYLSQQCGPETKTTRQESQKLVYKLFKKRWDKQGMIRILHREDRTYTRSTRDLSVWDKLAVAIAIDEVNLVRALLLQIQRVQAPIDEIFRNPLILAIKYHREGIIQAILNYIRKYHPLYPPGFNGGPLPGNPDLFEPHAAILEAIDQKQHSITQTLVKFYQERKLKFHKDDYNNWLLKAVGTADLIMVKQILATKIKSSPKVIQTTFTQACRVGNPEVVASLLDHMPFKPNTKAAGFLQFFQLIAAIDSGHTKVVQVVLDAGADLSHCGPVHRDLTPGYDFRSPLEHALNDDFKFPIAKMILDRGAHIGGFFPYMSESKWELLRQAKITRGENDVGEWNYEVTFPG